MITVKDIMKQIEHPNASKADHGGCWLAGDRRVGDYMDRAAALVRSPDVLTIDTAHGHSQGV